MKLRKYVQSVYDKCNNGDLPNSAYDKLCRKLIKETGYSPSDVIKYVRSIRDGYYTSPAADLLFNPRRKLTLNERGCYMPVNDERSTRFHATLTRLRQLREAHENNLAVSITVLRELQQDVIEHPESFNLSKGSKKTTRNKLVQTMLKGVLGSRVELDFCAKSGAVCFISDMVEYKGERYSREVANIKTCALSGEAYMEGVEEVLDIGGRQYALKSVIDKYKQYVHQIHETGSIRVIKVPEGMEGKLRLPETRRISRESLSSYSTNVLEVTNAQFMTMPDEVHDKKGDTLFMGVELEVQTRVKRMREDRMSDDKVISLVYDNMTQDKSEGGNLLCVIKSDGSLEGSGGSGTMGMEIVSTPSSYRYQMEKLWGKFFDEKKGASRYLRSYAENCCGMHVHVNKSYFNDEQQKYIGAFMHSAKNSPLLSAVAGRTIDASSSYSASTMCKTASEFKSNWTGGSITAMRGCVSFGTRNGGGTVEFRLFRGNVKPDSFRKNLQFVKATCDWVKSLPKGQEFDALMEPKTFVDYVIANREQYVLLYAWLCATKFIADDANAASLEQEDGAVYVGPDGHGGADDSHVLIEGKAYHFLLADLSRKKGGYYAMMKLSSDNGVWVAFKGDRDNNDFTFYKGEDTDANEHLKRVKLIQPVRPDRFFEAYIAAAKSARGGSAIYDSTGTTSFYQLFGRHGYDEIDSAARAKDATMDSIIAAAGNASIKQWLKDYRANDPSQREAA